jgi:hypothetical protein
MVMEAHRVCFVNSDEREGTSIDGRVSQLVLMKVRIFLLLSLLAFAVRSQAAAGKVESTPSFQDSAVSESIRGSLEKAGYRVVAPDGSVECEIWFRDGLPVNEKSEAAGTVYHLAESELIGIIRFAKPMTDFHGQQIKPGVYAMRYEMPPDDGYHLGAAPSRDFVLLLPGTADKDATAHYKFSELLSLSMQASGTSHPVPMALMSPSQTAFPALTESHEGWHILSVKLKSQSGNSLPFAIVIKGTALQ